MSNHPPKGDMKQGLTSARVRLSIVPRAARNYLARGLEYGGDKYARGNYHRAPPAGVTPIARVLGYLDAAERHGSAVSDAINHALGTGGDTAAALACVDAEASGGFPASGLPHLAHMLASVALAITCAVDDGLLPLDPGAPWRAALTAAAGAGLPQKGFV